MFIRLVYPKYNLSFIVLFVCCLSALLIITEDFRLSDLRRRRNRESYERYNNANTTTTPRYMRPEDVYRFPVVETNCSALFEGDNEEITRAIDYQNNHTWREPDVNDLIRRVQNCDTYARDAHFITEPVSQEEREFPLAYSIMMYRSPVMFERLLRSIYRPQNYYCIHVDLKAENVVYDTVKALADCFPNVVLASRREIVTWGSHTELWPDFICLEQLWEFPDWLYFINLTGEEFPLRTNLELVRIFKMIKGANIVGAQTRYRHPERYRFYFNGTVDTRVPKPPPPINVTMAHQMTHVALVRGAVDYILHDPGALAFRAWAKSTWFPDEFFWASLNISPQLGMPGAYTGKVKFHSHYGRNQLVTRYKIWNYEKVKCHGRFQRTICLMSVGHLHILGKNPKMFVNKFKQDFHPLAYDCLEQRIFHRVLQESRGEVTPLNETYYRDMDFVENHI